MKKVTIFVLAFLLSTLSYAQEFMGVSISGNKSDCVAKFTAKGFKYKKEVGNTVVMEGKLQSQNVDLFITSTPTSKQVWKFTVYYPEETSWFGIKGSYKDLKETLTEKYGKPESYEYFSKPYEEGDGYETTAIKIEKCSYSSFWRADNLIVALEISKYMQLKLSYESQTGVSKRDEEQSKIDKNTF